MPITPPADTPARLRIGERDCAVDLARPASLALQLAFDGRGPTWFGANAARSTPYAVPGFSGRVADGASCNCSRIELTPHCHGTHTECVGHLTVESLDVTQVAPLALQPAWLLSIAPEHASGCGESSDPVPEPGDWLLTRRALLAAWPAAMPYAPTALIVRTLPNTAAKRNRDYDRDPAPFLSLEAAEWIVGQDIEHLVVDLPSVDRARDAGRLTAHRVHFGLPPGSTHLAQARRPQATITELACIDDSVGDGPYLLALQLPALDGDAVPSRPVLYRVLQP
ncbi:MAG: cyclase family protein [Gammaproteobacteria bacterium]|nr:cyclase family protein [Gammaproteobacteria bacterium]